MFKSLSNSHHENKIKINNLNCLEILSVKKIENRVLSCHNKCKF